MSITRRGGSAVGCLMLVALIAAACGSSDSGGPADEVSDGKPLTSKVKITYLYTPATTSAPAYVALAKGYFADENLDVTMKPFTGDSAQVVPLLATGKADAIGTSSSPGFFNGIVNRLDVKFVLSGGLPQKGAPTAALLAKSNGPVSSVTDLEGRKVSLVGGAETVSGYYVDELLKQGGLTIDDVEVVNLDFPSGLAALKNGAVDAAIQFAPNIQNLVGSGAFTTVGDMDAVYAKGSPNGVILGPALLKDNRRAGVAFVRALQRAASTDLVGDYLKDPDIAAAIATGMNIPVGDTQSLAAPVFDPELAIDPGGFESVQRFWLDLGALSYDKPLPRARYIDEKLVTTATETKTS